MKSLRETINDVESGKLISLHDVKNHKSGLLEHFTERFNSDPYFLIVGIDKTVKSGYLVPVEDFIDHFTKHLDQKNIIDPVEIRYITELMMSNSKWLENI